MNQDKEATMMRERSRQYLMDRLPELREKYAGKCVAYIDGTLFVAQDINGIMEEMFRVFPGSNLLSKSFDNAVWQRTKGFCCLKFD